MNTSEVKDTGKTLAVQPQNHVVSGARILSFLTFALVGSEWSDSSPGRFTPGESGPGCTDGRGLTEDRIEPLGTAVSCGRYR
jgi:hypothetical protein